MALRSTGFQRACDNRRSEVAFRLGVGAGTPPTHRAGRMLRETRTNGFPCPFISGGRLYPIPVRSRRSHRAPHRTCGLFHGLRRSFRRMRKVFGRTSGGGRVARRRGACLEARAPSLVGGPCQNRQGLPQPEQVQQRLQRSPDPHLDAAPLAADLGASKRLRCSQVPHRPPQPPRVQGSSRATSGRRT